MEISVGPPSLIINHGSTFMVTDLCGQINPCDYLGLFSADTRFLSYYACYANGQSWIRLTSSATKYYAARVYLKNPELRTDDQIIPLGALSLVISRTAADGIHEDLDITNHSLQAVRFYLEITLRSDFADSNQTSSQPDCKYSWAFVNSSSAISVGEATSAINGKLWGSTVDSEN